MFYEVKVFDKKNNLKKTIPTKELSRKHWADFEKVKTQLSWHKQENDKQKPYLH
tara:strand:+ start:327 stop:488 length:162 start_codon:yes stop_codon:yes gene_type:complete